MNDSDRINGILSHPHCNEEIRESLTAAIRWVNKGEPLSSVWKKRLDKYDAALTLAADRLARGETPFVDLPREKKSKKRVTEKELSDKKAEIIEAARPDWMSNPSLLPMRPPPWIGR